MSNATSEANADGNDLHLDHQKGTTDTPDRTLHQGFEGLGSDFDCAV